MAQLTDMDITHVSLVDKGANQRRFAVKKQAGTGPDARLQKAIAEGIAKGSGRKTGVLGALRKAISPRRRITKSAADQVSQLAWALYYVFDVLEAVAADVQADPNDPDASADEGEVGSLQQISQDLLGVMASIAGDVGTADDLEDIAEQAAAYASAMQSYYPVYMRDGGIAKVGQKQFTQARLTSIKEAAGKLAGLLEEIETETESDDEDSKDTKKRAQPQEVNVTSDEIAAVSKAVAEALEPRIAAIEKRLPPAEDKSTVEKGAGQDGDITLADVAAAITKVADRVEKIETARGERTSIVGQDSPSGVKKRGTFAGMLTDA